MSVLLNPKPLATRHGPIAGARHPLICSPLVGRDAPALRAELATVLAQAPDVLEWRVDYFADIAQTAQVLAALTELRAAAGATPLLFTRRWASEGGERIALNETQVLALYAAVCASARIDWIDYELAHDAAQVAQVRAQAHAHGVRLVLSYHNFSHTPTQQALVERALAAEDAGADVAKLAVMPRSTDDVLTLLAATREADRRLRIPLVSMAMGPLGAITRAAGWVFGSAMTFAVGAQASAPGQMPVADVRAAIALLQRAMQVAPSP